MFNRSMVGVVVVALCAAFAFGGEVLRPQWEQGERVRYAGLAKTRITTEFDGHTAPAVMNNTVRSEFLIEVVEEPEAGGAIVDVWWDWVRIEGDSTTLVEPFVFDSRESEEAAGLVAQTFGPLTEMVGEKVRLVIDGDSKVSVLEPDAPSASGDGDPQFDELAGKVFGKEAVRYMVQSLVVWAHPGEAEVGDSWDMVLASGQHAVCTFQEIKESGGERVAIMRTTTSPEKNEKPSEVGANGEQVSVEHQQESVLHAIMLTNGRLVREESSMSVATKIESPSMKIDSEQSMTSVVSFVGVESVHDKGELDLHRHAQGQ